MTDTAIEPEVNGPAARRGRPPKTVKTRVSYAAKYADLRSRVNFALIVLNRLDAEATGTNKTLAGIAIDTLKGE